jgi:hypothetical protein
MPEPTDDNSSESPDRDFGDPSDAGGTRALWVLAGSLLMSALLHGGLFGGLHYLSTLEIDLAFETTWLDPAEELRGIGQQQRDRFAEIERTAPPKPDDRDDAPSDKDESTGGPKLDDDKLEQALDGDWEPPETPDPPEPKDTKPAASALAETDPDIPDDAQKPSEPSEPETPSASPSDSEPFSDIQQHAALNRAGPNGLPDMRSFAPGNARMTALIRLDRVRGQPYESIARKILRSLPDYRLLLGSPKVDPIRDLDSLFMASPDPRYVQNTFLAIRHSLSDERVVELLDARYSDSPTWETYESFPVRDLVPENPHYRDSRRILLTGEGLALVAKDKLLSGIVGPLKEDSELLVSDGDDASSRQQSETPPSLLDGLANLHRIADDDKTIVLVSARGLRFRMPGVGSLPRFESVRLAVTNPASPTLDIDLQFESSDKARRFAQRCPAIRESVDDAIPFSGTLGISALLSKLDCRPEGAFVNVHGRYTVQQVTELAELAAPFIPEPPALDQLPDPPPERTAPDASGDVSTGHGPDTGTGPAPDEHGGPDAGPRDE